jgi:hypothetical protein
VLLLWEDDDIYMPRHIENHLHVLTEHEFSYPKTVWSTYFGDPVLECTDGRFWASTGIRYRSFSDVGGFVRTRRADFDQQSVGRWMGALGHGSSDQPPTYCFRWGDTGAVHGQTLMKSPDDETWYNRARPQYIERHNLTGMISPETWATLMKLARHEHLKFGGPPEQLRAIAKTYKDIPRPAYLKLLED